MAEASPPSTPLPGLLIELEVGDGETMERVTSKSSGRLRFEADDESRMSKIDITQSQDNAAPRGEHDRVVFTSFKVDDGRPGTAASNTKATPAWGERPEPPGLLAEDEEHMFSKPSTRDASKIPSLKGSRSNITNAKSGRVLVDCRTRLRSLLETPAFELSVSIIIVLNTAVMGLEVQYIGIEQGHRMHFESTPPASETLPWAKSFLSVAEFAFGSIFFAEMCVKLLGFGRKYFYELWNWLDALIVMGWLITVQGSDILPISPVMLRAFRTVRVLRLIRLTRSLHSLDSLYTMMMALQGSLSIIAWSGTVLVLMQAMVAIILSAIVESFIENEDNPLEDRQEAFEYFGTFSRSLLSVFELTLANWPVPVRILTERVSEWLMPLLLSYVFLVGFGVVRVITGVFVTVTFYVAEHDDEIMIRRRVTAQTRHKMKMLKLFKAADNDGSGYLDMHEFCAIFQDMQVQTWLGAMEFGFSLYGSGPEALYYLLEKTIDGQIGVQSLVDGVARLKGNAKSFTLAMVMHDVKLAFHRAEQVMRSLTSLELEVKEHFKRKKNGVTWGEVMEIEKAELDSQGSGDQSPGGSEWKRRGSKKFSFKMPHMPQLRSMRTVAAMDSKSAIEKKLFHGNLEGRIDDEDEDESGQSLRVFLHNLAVSAVFEMSFMALIVAQAVIVALQTQYRGMEMGYDISYSGMTTRAEDAWPHASEVFQVIDIIFGIAFCFELLLKIVGLRKRFCKEFWNYLDVFATTMWIVELFAKSLPQVVSSATVRSVRLLRLARLLKLFKTRKEFRDVQLLWAALRGSFLSLFWSIILMFILLVMTGLFVPSLIHSAYLEDNTSDPPEERLEVHRYYGTFTKSLLTMFEMSLANWMIPTRVLTEKVSEWYMLYAIPHRLIVGFAMVTVLGAVFIQETFQIAKNDNAVQLNMRNRIIKHHIAKMQMFFDEADADGSGVVDKSEFKEIVSKPGMSLWLSAMGLDVANETDTLFQLIDNGDEQLTAAELLEGVARMKGLARNIDMTILHSELSKLRETLNEVRDRAQKIDGDVKKEGKDFKRGRRRVTGSGELEADRMSTGSAEDAEAVLEPVSACSFRVGKKVCINGNGRKESFDSRPPGENEDPFAVGATPAPRQHDREEEEGDV